MPDKSSPGKSFPVKNAGIVLLNPYLPILFHRLGFLEEEHFISKEVQADAVQYMQYLVTGNNEAEDSFLPLNNILCGLPVSVSLNKTFQFSDSDTELINDCLHAVISNWKAIGNTTPDGLRETFLLRDGLLVEEPGHWHLTVEKRAFDMLLDKYPAGFSTVKYSWMEKPLHVNWR